MGTIVADQVDHDGAGDVGALAVRYFWRDSGKAVSKLTLRVIAHE